MVHQGINVEKPCSEANSIKTRLGLNTVHPKISFKWRGQESRGRANAPQHLENSSPAASKAIISHISPCLALQVTHLEVNLFIEPERQGEELDESIKLGIVCELLSFHNQCLVSWDYCLIGKKCSGKRRQREQAMHLCEFSSRAKKADPQILPFASFESSHGPKKSYKVMP